MNPLSIIELDPHAFAHNLNLITLSAGTSRAVCLCLKANAYGHGAIEIAQLAQESGVEWLAVVNAQEVLNLRSAGIQSNILVLGYIDPVDLKTVLDPDTHLYIWTEQQLRDVSQVAASLDIIARIHIPIETGMGRLGVHPDNVLHFIKTCQETPHIFVEGIAHHYSTADETSSQYVDFQRTIFDHTIQDLVKHDLLPQYIHADNSAATLIKKSAQLSAMVRVGAVLYGFLPSDEVGEVLAETSRSLMPVMTWKTQVISIKTLQAGTSVSYGATERLDCDTRVAVIPIGYAD